MKRQLTETRAVLIGRGQGTPLRGKKRYYAFVRFPDIRPNRIWTIIGPEDPVPWGFRTAAEAVVIVDADQLGYTLTLGPDDIGWVRVSTERPPEDDSGEAAGNQEAS